MDPEQLRKLPPGAFTRVVKPLKAREPYGNTLVIGFDTEYEAMKEGPQETISVQLATSDGLGTLIEVPKDKILKLEDLTQWVRKFMIDSGKGGFRNYSTIILAAHFSSAELGCFSDWWQVAKVQQVSGGQLFHATWRVNKNTKMVIFDTFHFLGTSLAKAAETFGLKKLDYHRARISRKDLKDPNFRKYAIHDAVLAAQILEKLRRLILQDYNVDIFQYVTPASTAMAVFRKDYFRVPQEQWTKDDKGRTVEGWDSMMDMPFGVEARRMAWKALWGGRNEAYQRGEFIAKDGDAGWLYLDVTSLYPMAARLVGDLPGPHDWHRRHKPESWKGLCYVEFKFPEDCKYPCLPVFHDGRLMMPRKGRSHCTLYEAKLAEQMGAELYFHEVWECDTGIDGVERMMTDMMEAKAQHKANGDEPRVFLVKMLMNSLIGKFSQNAGGVSPEEWKAYAEEEGVPVEECMRHDYFGINPKPEPKPRIGYYIMPEWSALILGKARAIMGEMVHRLDLEGCESLHCATDSEFIPAEFEDIAMEIAADIGVELDRKSDVIKQLKIFRNRLWFLTDKEGKQDAATHSIAHRKQVALAIVRATEVGKSLKYRHEYNYGLLGGLRFKKQFREMERRNRVFTGDWDNKRYLNDDGTSRPWDSVAEYEEVVHNNDKYEEMWEKLGHKAQILHLFKKGKKQC